MTAADLALLCAGIVAFAVLAYVMLDGFDLGVGILFLWVKNDTERDQMMDSVAPVWDGNETWLILGGSGLFAAFPLAYAVIMPALYAPLIAMLLALVFRGVAFEFRWKTRRARFLWDWAFSYGSLAAGYFQGIVLGAMAQGIPVTDRAYAGRGWDWLTPFSTVTGAAVVIGYALLGATWLICKTTGTLQARARGIAWISGTLTLALIGLVSLWTPFLDPHYMVRWFGWPQALYVLPVPALVLACAAALVIGLRQQYERLPFIAALGLFALSFAGLCISFYPHIVPSSVTIDEAAAPANSLRFLLAATVVLLPLIVAYTAYAYRVFRGKVVADPGTD